MPGHHALDFIVTLRTYHPLAFLPSPRLPHATSRKLSTIDGSALVLGRGLTFAFVATLGGLGGTVRGLRARRTRSDEVDISGELPCEHHDLTSCITQDKSDVPFTTSTGMLGGDEELELTVPPVLAWLPSPWWLQPSSARPACSSNYGWTCTDCSL